MSKPKSYPPYKIKGSNKVQCIQDAHGNGVILGVIVSRHYTDILENRIMQIICDALNDKSQPNKNDKQ
jgi:hypothetical protein